MMAYPSTTVLNNQAQTNTVHANEHDVDHRYPKVRQIPFSVLQHKVRAILQERPIYSSHFTSCCQSCNYRCHCFTKVHPFPNKHRSNIVVRFARNTLFYPPLSQLLNLRIGFPLTTISLSSHSAPLSLGEANFAITTAQTGHLIFFYKCFHCCFIFYCLNPVISIPIHISNPNPHNSRMIAMDAAHP